MKRKPRTTPSPHLQRLNEMLRGAPPAPPIKREPQNDNRQVSDLTRAKLVQLHVLGAQP